MESGLALISERIFLDFDLFPSSNKQKMDRIANSAVITTSSFSEVPTIRDEPVYTLEMPEPIPEEEITRRIEKTEDITASLISFSNTPRSRLALKTSSGVKR